MLIATISFDTQYIYSQIIVGNSGKGRVDKKIIENMTFTVTNMNGKLIRGSFKNGIFENGKFGDKDYLRSVIQSISFGDLNNDGKNDAFVIIESAIYDTIPKSYDFYFIINADGVLNQIRLDKNIFKVGSLVSSSVVNWKAYLRYIAYDKGDGPRTPTKDVAYVLAFENGFIVPSLLSLSKYESICGKVSLRYLEEKTGKHIWVLEEGPLLSKIIKIIGVDRVRRIPELTEGPSIALEKKENVLSFASCKKPCISYSLSIFVNTRDDSVDIGWLEDNCFNTGAKNFLFSSNHPPQKIDSCLKCFGEQLSCFQNSSSAHSSLYDTKSQRPTPKGFDKSLLGQKTTENENIQNSKSSLSQQVKQGNNSIVSSNAYHVGVINLSIIAKISRKLYPIYVKVTSNMSSTSPTVQDNQILRHFAVTVMKAAEIHAEQNNFDIIIVQNKFTGHISHGTPLIRDELPYFDPSKVNGFLQIINGPNGIDYAKNLNPVNLDREIASVIDGMN